MQSTRSRMIAVAVLVCLFAVGMAGLLNYFKYRSTADRIVKERLLVIGKSVESSLQSSLAFGLQFDELDTLTDTMKREMGTDSLITGIDVFDADGHRLYSTDAGDTSKDMPSAWFNASRLAADADWFVEQGHDSAAGFAVKNNFGLTLGHLAVRFSAEQVARGHAAVARHLATVAAIVFVIAATLASLALLAVLKRLSRDVDAVAAALGSKATAPLPPAVRNGPFGAALQRFFGTVETVETELVRLEAAQPQAVPR